LGYFRPLSHLFPLYINFAQQCVIGALGTAWNLCANLTRGIFDRAGYTLNNVTKATSQTGEGM